MKKMISLALAVLMLATCLTGCGSKGKTLSDIQKNGKLVIATSPDFPPFEMLENNEVVGIEIDILKLICEKLGVELDIQQMDFESVLPGVQAGKYDLGVSGITITESRQKNALFTDSYCLAAQSIVVTKDSPIKSKADLQGKNVSVQTGTTAESFCTDEGYQVSSYVANSDAQLALTTGKVDAWVIDDLTAIDMVKAYNAEHGEELVILPEVMTTEPYAFGMALGSDELAAEINTIIDELVSNGTIAAIFEKYDAPYTAPTN